MTPDRYRECLALLGWSTRGFAAIVDVDERQARRWGAEGRIPAPIAAWLERLARYHEANPPPERRAID